MKTLHTVMLTAMALCTAGCGSIDCAIDSRTQCTFQFVKADLTPDTLSLPLSVTLMPASGVGDTVIINRLSGVSSFSLPLSYTSDCDKMVLTLHGTETITTDTITTTVETQQSDTLWIDKTNTPLFEAPECTPHYNHTITGVRHSSTSFVSEASINNPNVSKDETTQNIFIQCSSAD